ncbi:MAG TPA: ABC transporter ATP-binding protein [Streptosporangiaceae bacterium]|nr:ABC transporter ATP-binding protein [Streptosporangiaceae bacterium]
MATPDAQTDVGVRGEQEATPASALPAALSAPAAPAAPKSPLASLWRVRGYLRPYYGQILVMLAAALLGSGTEIAIPLLTKAAIDGPISASSQAGRHGYGLLIPIGAAAIALGIAEVALNLVRRRAQSTAVAGLEQAMRDDIYQHLQGLEPAFHDAWQSGQLLSRATTDLSAIRRFFGFGIVFMITSSASFVVIVVLLIRLNLLLGLLTAGVFAPVTALCMRFERRYGVLSRRVQDQQDDLATYVEEAAAGIRVIKALGRRDTSAAAHARLAQTVYETQVAKARLRGAFWASLDLVPNVTIAAILLIGALAVGSGSLTTGGLVAFVALVLQLVWPIEAMGYILALGQEGATAAQRVYEILDTAPTVTGPPALAGPAGQAVPRPRRPEAPSGRLVLSHVRFTYPGAAHPVLRDVCLDLSPGETVALVGGTGSGKTTLLYLIARLADATGGSITLDGTDVAGLPLNTLRTLVACAFEDPTLFSVSVRENVALGMPGASDESVRSALAAAQADFVDELPWGLDTRIGEQGMSLSGGQRQRIALARAILARPSVLLLDDPLSALDVHTEEKVTAALGQVLATSTALVVAHRPSTVALADRVALLEDGEITAVGTHHDLLSANPHYQFLMRTDAETGAMR